MIEDSVLSLDEESECSKDEDFEPIAINLFLSLESSEESSNDSSDEGNELHTETVIELVALAHIGDWIPSSK